MLKSTVVTVRFVEQFWGEVVGFWTVAQNDGEAAAKGATAAAEMMGTDQAIPLDTVRRFGSRKPVSDIPQPLIKKCVRH
ncbi:hypothetical protein BHE16_10530 [Neomicrococcus aestuarii]|uniref:Uncharacterized protein n=1 Tax=Neomicrococcus aestuarii TaxID=556325 RepID=A0A1L2ZPN9_9MICC|nr:hypothetical protein BHE16_10530 [Neomicrococcus aestuarii]